MASSAHVWEARGGRGSDAASAAQTGSHATEATGELLGFYGEAKGRVRAGSEAGEVGQETRG
jgi:hypothetical protein